MRLKAQRRAKEAKRTLTLRMNRVRQGCSFLFLSSTIVACSSSVSPVSPSATGARRLPRPGSSAVNQEPEATREGKRGKDVSSRSHFRVRLVNWTGSARQTYRRGEGASRRRPQQATFLPRSQLAEPTCCRPLALAASLADPRHCPNRSRIDALRRGRHLAACQLSLRGPAFLLSAFRVASRPTFSCIASLRPLGFRCRSLNRARRSGLTTSPSKLLRHELNEINSLLTNSLLGGPSPLGIGGPPPPPPGAARQSCGGPGL